MASHEPSQREGFKGKAVLVPCCFVAPLFSSWVKYMGNEGSNTEPSYPFFSFADPSIEQDQPIFRKVSRPHKHLLKISHFTESSASEYKISNKPVSWSLWPPVLRGWGHTHILMTSFPEAVSLVPAGKAKRQWAGTRPGQCGAEAIGAHIQTPAWDVPH